MQRIGYLLRVKEDERGVGYIIRCPWAKNHTSGDDEAIFYEPSQANHWRGGFKCLHQHCAGMGHTQFNAFVKLAAERVAA